MNHTHISESALNDYADGVLADSERRVVDVHVAECVQCAAELQELQALLATLSRAPRNVAPARDLRAGIMERTSPPVVSLASWRARSLWSARYTLAAAAIVLIVASSIVTRVLIQRRTESATSVATAPPTSPTDSSAAVAASQPMPVQAPQARAELVARHSQEFAAVEAEYARASEDLLNLLKRERSRLSPEAAKALDQNIRVIDKAIAETRAALRVQPDDAALRGLVRDSYERKLELLRTAARLTL